MGHGVNIDKSMTCAGACGGVVIDNRECMYTYGNPKGQAFDLYLGNNSYQVQCICTECFL